MHGPMSQWLQTTAVVFSLWLFIPVSTVAYQHIRYTERPLERLYAERADSFSDDGQYFLFADVYPRAFDGCTQYQRDNL